MPHSVTAHARSQHRPRVPAAAAAAAASFLASSAIYRLDMPPPPPHGGREGRRPRRPRAHLLRYVTTSSGPGHAKSESEGKEGASVRGPLRYDTEGRQASERGADRDITVGTRQAGSQAHHDDDGQRRLFVRWG